MAPSVLSAGMSPSRRPSGTQPGSPDAASTHTATRTTAACSQLHLDNVADKVCLETLNIFTWSPNDFTDPLMLDRRTQCMCVSASIKQLRCSIDVGGPWRHEQHAARQVETRRRHRQVMLATSIARVGAPLLAECPCMMCVVGRVPWDPWLRRTDTPGPAT